MRLLLVGYGKMGRIVERLSVFPDRSYHVLKKHVGACGRYGEASDLGHEILPSQVIQQVTL